MPRYFPRKHIHTVAIAPTVAGIPNPIPIPSAILLPVVSPPCGVPAGATLVVAAVLVVVVCNTTGDEAPA